MSQIRSFHAGDLPAIYRICLLTGDSGKDASSQYGDPDILGHFYAGPYAVLEPELCLVLEDQGAILGYILGTSDSRDFARRCETRWFPVLRQRYAGDFRGTEADMNLAGLIAQGYQAPDCAAEYPAHLHVDLLPAAQGQGMGRKLMDRFCKLLRDRDCPGLHLGVSLSNTGGIAFYERYGFKTLRIFADWQLMGIRL